MNKLLRSLKNENLTNKVVRTLKEYIIKEGLKEGDKLPTERKLSEVFMVSRNVVREALKSLEVTGIVYKIQGKGVFVDSFKSNIIAENILFGLDKYNLDFKELLEIRRSFEISVLKLLINKITDEDINVLQSIIDNIGKEKGKAAIQIDLKFHIKLLEILNNDFIKRFGMILVEFFKELATDRLDIIRDKINFEKKLLVRHQKILDALKERNLKKAIDKMENHFEKGYPLKSNEI